MGSQIKFEEKEHLRTQAISQLKEWISKHPKIRECRMDDKFLLRFLRTKKFSVLEACELLENYLTIRKTLPQLFEALDCKLPELKYFFDNNCVFVLPDKDKEGRPVIFYQVGNFTVDKCSAANSLRICNLTFEHLSIDEYSQINGVVMVIDCTNQNLAYTSIWTPPRLKDFAQCLQKAFPLRFQKIFFVNMPSFTSTLMQILLTFLSTKLKGRIKVKLKENASL